MAKYIFTKNSSLERPRNVSREQFASASYGQEFYYEPQDTPLKVYHLQQNNITQAGPEYKKLRSLKNIINYYKAQDSIFNFDNFYAPGQPVTLISFYSSHIGSGLEPGSVELTLSISGSLAARATDHREDGVLYQEDNDEKIGIVLYKEGFILLNNTASLTNNIVEYYVPTNYHAFVYDNPRWIYALSITQKEVSYDLSYGIKNEVASNINFVYADKNQYNHSNNITYIDSGSYSVSTSSFHFKENSEINIKNTIKSPFVSGSATNDKQTFITSIGLYDKNKKLMAIGSLANPVRKTENREYVFKLKFDI